MDDKCVSPFPLTNEMMLLVSQITEKVQGMQEYSHLGSMPKLRHVNRIRSIHSSLAIEANSLTLEQVEDVIDGRTVMGPQKEIQEVWNAYEAYQKIPEFDPYSLEDLKKAHGIMTRYLVKESGAFRSGEEGVFDGGRCLFMAPPAAGVPELMERLFAGMKESKGKVHPLILSSVFHYEFVSIHPFSDGNGRMARLWQTLILSKWNKIFPYIPLESRIQDFQSEYYEVIAQCDGIGNSDLFLTFMLRRIDEILEKSKKEMKESVGFIDPEKKLLSQMRPGIAYRAQELMQKVGLKSLKSFREHYRKPALGAGLIEMTIPDKPNSRNQRYRLKEK